MRSVVSECHLELLNFPMCVESMSKDVRSLERCPIFGFPQDCMLCTQEPRTAPQGTARRVGILVRSLQITALGQLTCTRSQILWTCSILGITSCDVLWHHLRLVDHLIFSAHVLPFGICNQLQLRVVRSLSLG